MTDPKQLRAIFEAAAPRNLDISFRAMFGGLLAYADGKPCASFSNIGLALKLSGANYDALLAQPGAVALRYEPDAPPSKSYVVVPTAMLEDETALRDWIERCVAGLPAPKAKRAKL